MPSDTRRYYQKVPNNSTLEVWVSHDPGSYDVSGSFTSSSGRSEWNEDDLVPGPATATLQEGRAYHVEITASFLADAAAHLHARVLKPDGTVHGTPATWVIDGSAGSTVLHWFEVYGY